MEAQDPTPSDVKEPETVPAAPLTLEERIAAMRTTIAEGKPTDSNVELLRLALDRLVRAQGHRQQASLLVEEADHFEVKAEKVLQGGVV